MSKATLTVNAPDISGMTITSIQTLVNELHTKASKPVVLPKSGPVKSGEWFWKMGQGYHIRTGTHHYTGTFIGFNGPNNSEIVITDAAWIADDGRFSDAIKTGELNEVEPYPDDEHVVINRAFINSAVRVTWPMPRVQK